MNLCDLNNIRTLLGRHGFHFSKAMGQNFLIDASIPQAIAEHCGADENCGVLEIGPGIGCLTEQLARRAGQVVSVELDRRLLPYWKKHCQSMKMYLLSAAISRKLDIAALVDTHFSGLTPLVCANLPYNITTPVLSALIDSGRFQRLTVMIQKEVAQRICALPGTADYGAFSLYMQFYTQPELLFDVPPDCFTPQPKVTSAVLRCTVRKAPPVDVADVPFFFQVVRAAFALRRKTLLNALSAALAAVCARTSCPLCWTHADFSPTVRGETSAGRIRPTDGSSPSSFKALIFKFPLFEKNCKLGLDFFSKRAIIANVLRNTADLCNGSTPDSDLFVRVRILHP